MKEFKVVGIAGSLRKASCNQGLLRYAKTLIDLGLNLELASIQDIPLFNADVEQEGKPHAVQTLIDQCASADALLLACPEYNYCMAPALKNALDWVSREPNNEVLNGKPVAIMGAGGGMGTSRAQHQLRQMCVYLNLLPINKPEVYINAFTGGFDASGDLIRQVEQDQVKALLIALQAWIRRLG